MDPIHPNAAGHLIAEAAVSDAIAVHFALGSSIHPDSIQRAQQDYALGHIEVDELEARLERLLADV